MQQERERERERQDLDRIGKIVPCMGAIPSEEWASSGYALLQVPPRPVIEQGHLFAHVSFVLSGCVRIHKTSPAGKELTLYRLRSGEACVLMLASILGNIPYEAQAETEEETELLVLPVPTFRRWLHTFPELNEYVYQLFMRRMIAVTESVEERVFHSMDQRTADLLLRKIRANPAAPLYTTHEAIAMELGTAREVVSRTMKKFEQLGWVRLGRGKIHILQPNELEQAARVK